jgi:hypothetical protein
MAAVQLESVAAQNVEIFPQGPLVDGKDTARVKGSSPERLENGLMQYGYAPLLVQCYLIFI